MPTERGTQHSAAPGVLSGLYHQPKRQQDGIVTERDVTGPYNEMNDLCFLRKALVDHCEDKVLLVSGVCELLKLWHEEARM